MSETEGCHLIWKRSFNKKTGYPQIRLLEPNEKKMNLYHAINPGHILYAICNDVPLNRQEERFQISHLCHVKTCILPEHLNYEPEVVNKQRNRCAKSRKCTSHFIKDAIRDEHYPPCVL